MSVLHLMFKLQTLSVLVWLLCSCLSVKQQTTDVLFLFPLFTSDGETFISADDLRINLWNLEISNQSFNIVDVKPANMEDLTGIASFYAKNITQAAVYFTSAFENFEVQTEVLLKHKVKQYGAFTCVILVQCIRPVFVFLIAHLVFGSQRFY